MPHKASSDVLQDTLPIEDHHPRGTLLTNPRDMRARPILIKEPDVLLVEAYRPLLGFIHPEKELCDGGFARAGRADDKSGFVGRKEERNVGENRDGGARRVRKSDVVEGKFTITPGRRNLAQRAGLASSARDDRSHRIGRGRRVLNVRGRRRRRRRRIADEGQQSDHGEFALGKGDKLRNRHLQIARGDQTSPKHSHDIASAALALADEFGTEPEALDEHGHHHELGDARGGAPDAVEPFRGGFEAVEGVVGAVAFHVGRVEGFDGGDGGDGAVDDGGCDAGLFAFVCEERAGEALGEALDEHEDGDGGEDDEGECP